MDRRPGNLVLRCQVARPDAIDVHVSQVVDRRRQRNALSPVGGSGRSASVDADRAAQIRYPALGIDQNMQVSEVQ